MKERLKPGDKFGSLVVLEYDRQKRNWKCRCDCGAIVYKAATWMSPTSSCARCYRKRGGWERLAF
jgi:hypothetical protein